MFVREMKLQDHMAILEVARSLPEWFTANGLKALENDLKNQMGIVVSIEDKLIGFCIYSIDRTKSNISWMACHPQHHRRGIGSSLLVELKQALRKQGVQFLFVSTLGDSVDYEPYQKTRFFYRKNGFNDYKRIQHPDNPEQEEELILCAEI